MVWIYKPVIHRVRISPNGHIAKLIFEFEIVAEFQSSQARFGKPLPVRDLVLVLIFDVVDRFRVRLRNAFLADRSPVRILDYDLFVVVQLGNCVYRFRVGIIFLRGIVPSFLPSTCRRSHRQLDVRI